MKIEVELDDHDWNQFKILKRYIWGRRLSYMTAFNRFVRNSIYSHLEDLEEEEPEPPEPPRQRRKMQLWKKD